MSNTPARAPKPEQGPFHADQLRDGDRYELSQGHPLYCAPAGPAHDALPISPAPRPELGGLLCRGILTD